MDVTTCDWNGYDFQILDARGNWNEVGGLYIFAYTQSPDLWNALYIGQTGSFRTRLPNHPYWPEAVRLGATLIHAKVVPDEAQRIVIERQLIETYQPPMNASK